MGGGRRCQIKLSFQHLSDGSRAGAWALSLSSSCSLRQQSGQQEIQYQTAIASLTDAEQGYDIQLNQNISDIKAAEQKARFARMDFDKFLGDTVTQDIIDRLGLEKELAAESTNGVAKAMTETPPTLNVPPNSGLVVAPQHSSDAPQAIEQGGGVERPA